MLISKTNIPYSSLSYMDIAGHKWFNHKGNIGGEYYRKENGLTIAIVRRKTRYISRELSPFGQDASIGVAL